MPRTLTPKLLLAGGGLLLGVAIAAAFIIINVLLIRIGISTNTSAVKFTPEGGAIGIEVVGDLAAQCVRLTVWDTGIGIAAEDLPRLFQPFVQLDSRLAREYTGTGLGLALVSQLAAAHGGSIAVESTLG
ncbi:MAG TPA: ATP-binding protein, partial [Roseiflexaceae bacterium]